MSKPSWADIVAGKKGLVPDTKSSSGSSSGSGSTGTPQREPAFMMLPGQWTGDMWHCAAASILAWKEDPTVIQPYPVTVIGIVEQELNGSGRAVISQSFKRGGPMFEFFRAIGIPCLLAKISTQNHKSVKGAMMNLTPGYIQHIVSVYVAEPKSSFQQAWTDTKTADVWASDKKKLDRPLPAVATSVLFPGGSTSSNSSSSSSSDNDEEYVWDPPAGFKSGPLMDVMASTTITMQYLSPSDTRSARIKSLHDVLVGTDSKATWLADASALINQLVTLTQTQHGWTEEKGRNIILLNYREGDVNRQHDAHRTLFETTRTLAGQVNGQFKIVPIMVGGGDEMVKTLTALVGRDGYINLYPDRAKFYDKRYPAAFWRLVATKLSDRVFGLIGGRSGSMDIASFMGVNTCSWDEPLFASNCGYSGRYLLSQQRQYLRLYNQFPCMSITTLDIKSLDKRASQEKGYNVYNALDSTLTSEWMKRAPEAAKTVRPPMPDNTAAKNAVAEAYVLMERVDMGIKAVNIRGLPGGAFNFK
ncbi:hypothetical protein H2201_001949 [Coniosporium apollinis]|uniref:Uncharacterized protein n=1 Tax=Coniosporium apollinis TaxID=61459 RepID=A0ABQ9P4I1_9PEZI|nr:hypothetical protein H2201_001949 [Coniosporium apollinis]